MFLVSPIVNAFTAILPPRTAFSLLLHRLDRWRTFEHGYHLVPMLVDRHRSALDIGANEGFYAGKLARYVPRVHCFEPIPWLADALERKLPGNATVHRVAVSDRCGSAVLRVPLRGAEVMHGTATIEGANTLTDADAVREISCERVTLDGFLDDPVGFVKIDVEGHELAILEGARSLLMRDRPTVLIESEHRHHPGAPTDVFSFFHDLGYVGLALMNDRLFNLEHFNVDVHQAPDRKGRAYVNNFLFVPPLAAPRPRRLVSTA